MEMVFVCWSNDCDDDDHDGDSDDVKIVMKVSLFESQKPEIGT